MCPRENGLPPRSTPFVVVLRFVLSPRRTSRSNWAKDNSTLSVRRPIELVVLNCWVTETNCSMASDLVFGRVTLVLGRYANILCSGNRPTLRRSDSVWAAGKTADQ